MPPHGTRMTSRNHIDSELKQLGARLKWARELVEPNRTEFARSLRVDVSTIRNVENGTRWPSVTLLAMICHSLRISFDYLLNGELHGVDGELAALLLQQHPELAPAPGRPRGKPGRGAYTYTAQPTTIPGSGASIEGH